MTDDKQSQLDSKPEEMRLRVGPVARQLLYKVPQNERVPFLDEFILGAGSREIATTEAVHSHAERDSTVVLSTLSDGVFDMLVFQEQMVDAIKVGFNQLLEELKNTRALIGTTLVEDDERQAIIERMHVVTETRQAAADAIAHKIGLDLNKSRREMEEQIAPVVKDARDPEQDTELQVRDTGGRER